MTENSDKKPERRPLGHGPGFNADCKVCQHPYLDEIERQYLACRSLLELSNLTMLDQQAIEKHMVATGAKRRRADSTEELLAYAVNSAFDRGMLDDLDTQQALDAIKHIEKRQGKVKGEGGPQRPAQVFFIGIPAPGGVIAAPQAQAELPADFVAEVIPMLPPSESEE